MIVACSVHISLSQRLFERTSKVNPQTIIGVIYSPNSLPIADIDIFMFNDSNSKAELLCCEIYIIKF